MNNLSFFSKGLFIREVGRDKKQDGTIFFPVFIWRFLGRDN